LGLAEVELRLERATERDARALVRLLHRDRRVRVPARLREGGADALLQRDVQRRARGLGQERQLGATVGLEAVEVLRERPAELSPAATGAVLLDLAGTLVVVEREDLGLVERRSGAARDRVVGVALDLGRAPFPGRHQHAGGVAAVRERRRVVQRLARRDVAG